MENIRVPNIYFWEHSYNGKPELMTAAFKWRGLCFGQSFQIDEHPVRRKAHKAKLIEYMKEALDLLVHHGARILDSKQQIDPKKVNDAEAERFWLDQKWRDRVVALRKVMIVKEITEEKAKILGLL